MFATVPCEALKTLDSNAHMKIGMHAHIPVNQYGIEGATQWYETIEWKISDKRLKSKTFFKSK